MARARATITPLQPANGGSRQWLTIEQVLVILPVSKRTLDEWVRQGVLKAHHVKGSRIRFFRIEDVENLPSETDDDL